MKRRALISHAAKTPANNLEACRNIVSAMIAQAVSDYRWLVAEGFTDGVTINAPKVETKVTGHVVTGHFIQELIAFFSPGGAMEKWLEWADLDLDAGRIRKELGVAK